MVDFGYESVANVTAYLEINGRIPWRGRVGFDGSALPEDESNLTIIDGTDRGTITFEFDTDGLASGTPDQSIEALQVSGTGGITLNNASDYVERNTVNI